MNNRVSGTIYRGEAVYYTFQRLATGAAYLKRQEDKGKDLKTYRVVFTRDGEQKEMSGTKFASWASGLKSEAAPARAAKGSKAKAKATPKKAATKPRTRKAAAAESATQEPGEE